MSFDDLDRLLGAPRNRSANAAEERPCVLVIDDDQLILRALRMILSTSFDVTLAASAEEGLQLLSQHHEVAVVDIRMPGHDGFWACDRIHERFPDLPVIFHTAYQDEKSAEGIQSEHRPFACVKKDGDLVRMLSTVSAAIASRRPPASD